MAIDTEGSGLARHLNWLHGITIMSGMMVGAGIFVIAGQAASDLGPLVPLVFLGVIPALIATALIYSIYMSGPLGEYAGGAYLHISRTWDSSFLGYIIMWVKWIAYPGSIAAIGISLGGVIHSFDVLSIFSAQTWALVSITVLFLIHLSGVDVYGDSQNLLTIALILALLLLTIPGLFLISGGNFTPLLPQELYSGGYIDPILSGAATLLFSFIGFEALAQAGEEMDAQPQTFTKLFVGTSLGVGILYALVTFVVIGTIGWQTAASVEEPLTQAAQTYFPAGTAIILTFASVLAYITTMSTCYLVPSRLTYSFSEDRIIPDAFAHINNRFKTPDMSLLLVYLVSVIFVTTGTFKFGVQITVLAVTIVYFTHSLSGMVLPWLRPELYKQSQFRPSPVMCVVIGGVSAIMMGIFGWQTLSLKGIEPAITMMLQGDIFVGLTSNSAAAILVWGTIGAIIFFGYRIYLHSRGVSTKNGQLIRQLYDSSKSDMADD